MRNDLQNREKIADIAQSETYEPAHPFVCDQESQDTNVPKPEKETVVIS